MSFHASPLFKHLLIIFALAAATAACDGPVGPQGEQGVQGPEGPAGQGGADGADGNANVTLYIFDGYDATSTNTNQYRCIDDVTETQYESSEFRAFLGINSAADPLYIPTPGTSGLSQYGFFPTWSWVGGCSNAEMVFWRNGGPGELIYEIRVFKIEANSIEDCQGGGCLRAEGGNPIPDDLNMTDYNAVVEYFGITEDDIVRM